MDVQSWIFKSESTINFDSDKSHSFILRHSVLIVSGNFLHFSPINNINFFFDSPFIKLKIIFIFGLKYKKLTYTIKIIRYKMKNSDKSTGPSQSVN